MATAWDLINTALSYYGTSYKRGQASRSLVDCSGLTLRALEAIGIKVPHKAALQAEMGQRVNGLQNAQPGDLVFFSGGPTSVGTKNGVGHVAIYLGNGLVMEARGKAYKAGVYQLGNRASKIYSIQRFTAPSSQPIYIPQVDYTVPAQAGGGFGQGVAFPANGSMGGSGNDVNAVMETIKQLESGGNYTAQAKGSSASGAYQFTNSTWGNYGGYSRAKDAPPEVQDAKAREHINGILSKTGGDVSLVPAFWYVGHNPTQAEWDKVPVPGAGNKLTIRQYQQKWMDIYNSKAGSGGTFNPQQYGPDSGQGTGPGYPGAPLNPTRGPEAVAAGAAGVMDAVGGMAATGGIFTAPTGGTVYKVSETGESYVVYNIGSAKTAFHLTSGINTSGLTQGGSISQSQWDQMSIVMGGEGAELSALAGQDFNVWLEQQLITLFGQNNPARNDPGVQAVIAELIGRPDMDPAELQNRLKATAYYQSMTQAQMAWNDLPEAEKGKQRDDQAQRMIDTIFAETGLTVDQNDPMVQAWLEDLASGKVGYGAFTAEVRRRALENPESPWAQTIRDEEESQRQRPFDIENMTLNVKKLFQQWGVPVTAGTAAQWARDIVEMRQSEDDLLNTVKQQAQVMFATKPPDMDTTTWASPWMSTYGRLMEKEVDLSNKDIQKWLTNGTPVFEAEQELMGRPEWMGTKNGVNSMANAVAGLGNLMGFS